MYWNDKFNSSEPQSIEKTCVNVKQEVFLTTHGKSFMELQMEQETALLYFIVYKFSILNSCVLYVGRGGRGWGKISFLA